MPDWSWTSALVGAATAAAASAAVIARPRDPTFHLVSISLTSFRLSPPFLDVELDLTVHVTNPNLVPIRYFPATMSIFYAGILLGSAQVHAGAQPPSSCQLLHLPARLSGLRLAQHVAELLKDAAQGEMVLDAEVDIHGDARVLWWWGHRFSVHVKSHVVVDPVFMEILEKENKSDTQQLLS